MVKRAKKMMLLMSKMLSKKTTVKKIVKRSGKLKLRRDGRKNCTNQRVQMVKDGAISAKSRVKSK